MIRLENFSCGYGKHPVLTIPSLEIAPGKNTVILGKNGSGKSTLAQVLAGLKMDFRGRVWLDELRLKRFTPIRALRQKVGLVLQNPDHQILFGTVQDEIGFALRNLELPEIKNLPDSKSERVRVIQAERQKIIRDVLNQVGLSSKEHVSTQELSGGQKQRLALASVLALHPRYLVLDEVTSMLDLSGRHAIYQIIQGLKEEGIGIIMITNSQEEILLADSVLILDDGRIHPYSPMKLIKNNQILAKHGLGVPLLLQLIQKMTVSEIKVLREQL